MRGTKLVDDCGCCRFSPVADCDSPPCGDSIGVRACRRAGLAILTAGTGSGPEGSRPTADNCRLQTCGEENVSGSTGLWHCRQPPACPHL